MQQKFADAVSAILKNSQIGYWVVLLGNLTEKRRIQSGRILHYYNLMAAMYHKRFHELTENIIVGILSVEWLSKSGY